MKRVYIAGKLSDDACGYLRNVHRMIQWAEQVRKRGYAVYVPAIDLIQGVVFGNWEYPDYFNNSQPFLDVCDAVFLVPGWETSGGTAKEIERAKGQGIPVFTDLETLRQQIRSGI